MVQKLIQRLKTQRQQRIHQQAVHLPMKAPATQVELMQAAALPQTQALVATPAAA